MKPQELRKMAAQLISWAEEMEDRQAPDLFTSMGMFGADPEKEIDSMIEDLHKAPVEVLTDVGVEDKPRRTRRVVACKMNESVVVRSAEKLGRKQGFCRRDHIESTLWRLHPDISRETIRQAFNAAVTELDITCHRSGTRRCYRITQRPRILEAVEERLKKMSA